MTTPYPDDLTENEWKLLQLLSTTDTPFHPLDAYERFNSLESEEIGFYKLFFNLHFEGYLHLQPTGKDETLNNGFYKLTNRGSTALLKHSGK